MIMWKCRCQKKEKAYQLKHLVEDSFILGSVVCEGRRSKDVLLFKIIDIETSYGIFYADDHRLYKNRVFLLRT